MTASPAESQERTPLAEGSTTEPLKTAAPAVVAPSGRRQAFQDLKRGLTDSELASPGAQKLLLDMLEQAERERDGSRVYADKFHDSDKRCAIAEEKLRGNKANEIFFGVGVGVGGAVLGFVPAVWDRANFNGPMMLVFGLLLVVGSTIGRLSYK